MSSIKKSKTEDKAVTIEDKTTTKPAAEMAEAVEACEKINAEVNELLDKVAETKVNSLDHCDEDAGCGCGDSSGSGSGKVDLIVLIDSSGSMHTSARSISDAADAAITAASDKCPTDLRVTWLGVDPLTNRTQRIDIFPGTKFLQSHEDYLDGIGYTGTFAQDNPVAHGGVGYAAEEGADAISVLSNAFDWREDACRAIFYISDTGLDSYHHTLDEDIATDNAIIAANDNDVSVFSHLVEPFQAVSADTKANYTKLSDSTNGKAHIGGRASTELYEGLLEEVICNACGVDKCKEAEIPEISPCISIKWGDDVTDQLETEDFEVLTITVSNCYANVIFSNFKIGMLKIVDESGSPVALMPDGTPSVQLHPVGPYCFGNIQPCDTEGSSVSREFILKTCGAKQGKYKIEVEGVCFDVTNHYQISECFGLQLVKS